MFLIWLGVALVGLKLAGISVFADLSWWWVLMPFAVALFWFEVVERRLGWDKKRAHDEIENHRKKRIARTLEADRRGKPR